MQALRFHAARDLRVEDVAEPTQPGAGEVVVKVVTCGICGTDLHEFVAGPIVTPTEPHPLTGARNPQILGHEFAGDVVAVGAGVTRVAEGDRVAIMPLVYCGSCSYCRRGLQHLCATMACVGLSHPWGGMAKLAVVAEYQVVLLPDGVSYRQGALIEPAAVAAYGGDLLISISCPQIIGKAIRDRFPKGAINLHGSPLPRYRGLMPAFWVLRNGEKETAITVHELDAKLDDGAILAQETIPIAADETWDSLVRKTKGAGAQLLIQTIRQIADGTVQRRPNLESEATYFSFPTADDKREFAAAGRRFF